VLFVPEPLGVLVRPCPSCHTAGVGARDLVSCGVRDRCYCWRLPWAACERKVIKKLNITMVPDVTTERESEFMLVAGLMLVARMGAELRPGHAQVISREGGDLMYCKA